MKKSIFLYLKLKIVFGQNEENLCEIANPCQNGGSCIYAPGLDPSYGTFYEFFFLKILQIFETFCKKQSKILSKIFVEKFLF